VAHLTEAEHTDHDGKMEQSPELRLRIGGSRGGRGV
jgi:hypothetical protein